MMKISNKIFNCLVFLCGSAMVSSSYAATWATTDIGPGFTQSISFNGVVEGSVISGLTAEADLTLASVVDSTWTFEIDLSNTSSAPITDSRVSVFGFNTDPAVNVSLSSSSSTSGDFSKIGTGNVPQSGVVDICANTQNNTCSGGGSGGVSILDSDTITMALVFDTAPGTVTLSDFNIRYQAILPGSICDENECSGTGFVPIPAAAWLFGSGLIGLAGIARKRKAA